MKNQYVIGLNFGTDYVRAVLVDASIGNPINVSFVDLGNRFRFIANEVEAIVTMEDLPKLPVARVFWAAKPNLEVLDITLMLAGSASYGLFSSNFN